MRQAVREARHGRAGHGRGDGTPGAFAAKLAEEALAKISRRDEDGLEKLFAPSVRQGRRLRTDIRRMMDAVPAGLPEEGTAVSFPGVRASDGGVLRYEYGNAWISGLKADHGRMFELRVCAFSDGISASANRGIATASLVDVHARGAESRSWAESAGFMPVT